MEGYTAYVLDNDTRDALLQRFPPKYPSVVAHHITVQFGVNPTTAEVPPEADVKVVGYVDSGDGLEALVVSINGSTTRADNKTYHITWSLIPEKYKPVNSNDLLQKKRYTLVRAIPIEASPQIL